MMYRIRLPLVAVILGTLTSAFDAAGKPQQFTLNVSGSEGPLVGLCLSGRWLYTERAIRANPVAIPTFTGITNDNGDAVWEFESSDIEGVQIDSGFCERLPNESDDQLHERGEQSQQLRKKYIGPYRLIIHFDSSRSNSKHSYFAPHATKLQVRVSVEPPAIAKQITLNAPGTDEPWHGVPNDPGLMVLDRIPVHRAGQAIIAYDGPDRSRRAIRVSIPDTEGAVNLGEIKITDWTCNAKVHVQRQRSSEPQQPGPWIDGLPGISLLSMDGSIMIGTCVANGKSESELSVPAGTYYEFPSGFIPTQGLYDALERVAAGVDISKCGFPQVTVAAGEEKALVFRDIEVNRALDVMYGNVH